MAASALDDSFGSIQAIQGWPRDRRCCDIELRAFRTRALCPGADVGSPQWAC